MDQAKLLTTQMEQSSMETTSLPCHVHLHRQVIGELQYLPLTRPEIAFTVIHLTQFVSTPTEEHRSAVKHAWRHLKGTLMHDHCYSVARLLLLEHTLIIHIGLGTLLIARLL